MIALYTVITNSGDGSNGVRWVRDTRVLDLMEELADEGDERYASGDGLQVTKLLFPDNFDLESWLELNHITLETLEDMQDDSGF